MAISILNARVLTKLISGSPTVPTAPDHNDPGWLLTDIYRNELVINEVDKLFTRDLSDNIKQLNRNLLDGDDTDGADGEIPFAASSAIAFRKLIPTDTGATPVANTDKRHYLTWIPDNGDTHAQYIWRRPSRLDISDLVATQILFGAEDGSGGVEQSDQFAYIASANMLTHSFVSGADPMQIGTGSTGEQYNLLPQAITFIGLTTSSQLTNERLSLARATGTNVNIYPATGIGAPVSYDLYLPQAQGGINTVLLNDGSGNLSWASIASASTNIKYGAATQASAGVYTSTITGVSAYTTGDVYVIKFDTVNNGASTLNINSIGAVNIYKNTSTPISSGDIKANQTVELVYDGTNFQAIGLIPSQLLAYVHNAEGAVINKGQVVYAYQATGNKMSVKLARADSDATSAKTIGLVYDSSIGIGGEGYIIIQGVIEGLNTAAYSAGDTLYLSGTTYGAMTNTKPYAPTHLVYVGIVEKANAGAGQIYVRCQNGYELDEIHNVDAFNPNNNDGIFYNTGTSLWEHKSIATVLGYTPASNAITISTSTPLSGGGDLSANRTISIADAVANGSTKGAATFTASDFNSSSGLISIDYANGQKASASQAGFLSSTDWTIFNNKLSGNQTITLSGDVSGSGATSISTTIGAGAVTLSKMANLTANTIIGNNTGVAATPLALTGTQVTAMLDTFSTSATTKGLVTGSNGLGNTYFLRADGTWAVPAGGGGGGNPFSMNVVSVNTNAGSTADTHYFYLVSGTTTITLPTAVGNTSIYTIKRTGVNNVQVATTSSQTIDGGAAPITLTVQYQSLNFVSDGSNWAIF